MHMCIDIKVINYVTEKKAKALQQVSLGKKLPVLTKKQVELQNQKAKGLRLVK